MDPKGVISLNSYLGIDKRGKSAFNFYRKSIAQKQDSSRNNTSHVSKRVNFKQFDIEKYTQVGEPKNRPTIFAKLGDYNGLRNFNDSDYTQSRNGSPESTAQDFAPRVPKSQKNVPENIRKHSLLIKEAQNKLEKE